MRILLLKLLPFILILLLGCNTLNSIGKSIKVIKTQQDLKFYEIKYLASDLEKEDFYNQKSELEQDKFISKFWKKRDPTSKTATNEFKDEFFRRKKIADQRYKSTTNGSMTDRGRVLILYGEPDQIIYENGQNMSLGSLKIYGLEIWLYHEMAGTVEMSNVFSYLHHGRKKFVFADQYGFGRYSQIYSSEKNEKIDVRVYKINNDF